MLRAWLRSWGAPKGHSRGHRCEKGKQVGAGNPDGYGRAGLLLSGFGQGKVSGLFQRRATSVAWKLATGRRYRAHRARAHTLRPGSVVRFGTGYAGDGEDDVENAVVTISIVCISSVVVPSPGGS